MTTTFVCLYLCNLYSTSHIPVPTESYYTFCGFIEACAALITILLVMTWKPTPPAPITIKWIVSNDQTTTKRNKQECIVNVDGWKNCGKKNTKSKKDDKWSTILRMGLYSYRKWRIKCENHSIYAVTNQFLIFVWNGFWSDTQIG